ncbi:hypothetical protein BTA51_20490 [Hahella sp. CCB-MM4]|uniref:HAD family hydrolase n=1 Tax=Hahella sp. (strain CCB-MM4) TaxID=1926491 RepID=UPI000B9ADA40|nr:HAD family hydrolase [Hahella sp. CCB-MM4]OZG71656.1 hypothetical protein BTA51_20490 [Hahella sp. CCB-MM4]
MDQVNKKLLILDLDETLIHATEQPLSYRYDFRVGHYYVYKRPEVDRFLNFCAEYLKVAVWTASSEAYADSVVGQLVGQKLSLEFIWARGRCVTKFDSENYQYLFLKDLKKVKKKGFSLESVIVVDDSPEKLSRNYGNLVRISPFEGDQSDAELIHLMPYLKSLIPHTDVRKIEKRGWRRRLTQPPFNH